MAAAWSDEDASSSESSRVEEISLMVDHEVTSSPFSSHSSNNSRIFDEDELSHEVLVETLSDVCSKLKSMNKEKRSLQKFIESILFEKENLQKQLLKIISDKKTLEEKIEEKISKSTPQPDQQEIISKLAYKNDHLKKLFKKFKFSQKSLDSILIEIRRSHTLSGL